uniref:Uncharacterized protein n=1 Tax=Arundo donax TaxID=35708 RepID=A0A0A8Z5L1_ARUDO
MHAVCFDNSKHWFGRVERQF